MGPVARHARTQYLDIRARRLEAGRRRGDPYQAPAGLQYLVGAHLHLAADRVEHNVAIGYGSGEILRVVIDDPVGAELADVIVIAGAGSRDDGRADVLGELDREAGDPAGATLDQDGFAALQAGGVL